MHNVEFVDIKTFSLKNISLYIQLLLVFCILGCGIAFIFVKNTNLLVNILYGLLSLTMLVMAYNNKIFFKRKRMTIVYILISIILTISLITNLV